MDTESSRVFRAQGSGLILMDGVYELTTQIKSKGLQYMILNVDGFSGQHLHRFRSACTFLAQSGFHRNFIQYTISSKLVLIHFE